jgi:hypothetical protein
LSKGWPKGVESQRTETPQSPGGDDSAGQNQAGSSKSHRFLSKTVAFYLHSSVELHDENCYNYTENNKRPTEVA